MNLTPIDSARWNELGYCWSDDRLVKSLRFFTDASKRSQATIEELENRLDTINDSIFHQQSTYPATFITVPILVDVCQKLPYSLQKWIIDMVSWISTQRGPHGDLTETELATYSKALKLASKRSEELFRQHCDQNSYSKLILLGAVAILNGWHRIGSKIRHGNEEDFHVCNSCDEELINQGYAIRYAPGISMDRYLNCNLDASPRYLTPIERVLDFDGQQTPIVAREKFLKDSKIAWLIQLASETGNPKIVSWLQNFFGNGHCPNCDAEIVLGLEG